MKIKNIKHNLESLCTCKCGCATWLQHWEKQSGHKPPTFCIVSTPDCLEKTNLAAFVQKVGDNTDNWYLAPLCKRHSTNKTAEYFVHNTWPLIEITANDCICLAKDNELDFFFDSATAPLAPQDL